MRQKTFPYTDPHEPEGVRHRRFVKVEVDILEIRPHMFGTAHRVCSSLGSKFPIVESKTMSVSPFGKVCIICSHYLAETP